MSASALAKEVKRLLVREIELRQVKLIFEGNKIMIEELVREKRGALTIRCWLVAIKLSWMIARHILRKASDPATETEIQTQHDAFDLIKELEDEL